MLAIQYEGARVSVRITPGVGGMEVHSTQVEKGHCTHFDYKGKNKNSNESVWGGQNQNARR